MIQKKSQNYTGFRDPGIRMMEPELPSMNTIYYDAQLSALPIYHMFDKAHTVMLTEEKLIPLKDGKAMLKELRQLEKAGIEKVRQQEGGGSHSGEQFLIRRLGLL